jgi:hypothetical protein
MLDARLSHIAILAAARPCRLPILPLSGLIDTQIGKAKTKLLKRLFIRLL